MSVALTGACLALLTACGGGMGTSAGGRAESAAGAPVAPTMAAPQKDGEGGQKAPAEQVKVTQEQRQIIYVARVTVRAKDVFEAGAKAKQIVTAAGGYVSKEDSSSAEQSEGRSTLEFKVPPAAYPGVLAALGKDLGKQLSSTQTAEDVTQQVADINSRVSSAEESLASLRALLKQATTVGQVMEVEQQIYSRTAELESLQAQQKELARQTAHATITLDLIGPVSPEPLPEEEKPPGFLDGLKGGWDALVSFVRVALMVLGALLPWMLVIVPVLLVTTWALRRRSTPPPPPVAEPEREKEPV
ncbi:DUF4349 domain-containing protein [Nonomuraea soli]|uniref:DUF4349 domain-containing protein n=1 Tax=Nonomuraea soli TaxID=1032476 RepID=A0A7W0HSZ1_9ACTN|nr:DUF4349 domain-containing protein [Nonomuraea soli]MBA2894505.1 hypothetical protein [Nonomuraea soli]